MTIDIDDIMKIPEIFVECDQVKVTIRWSLGGGAVTACCTMVGGAFGGPVGMISGAAIGSFASYFYSRNKFKSLYTVYHEDLTLHQKERLQVIINKIISDFEIKDLYKLAAALRSDKALLVLIVSAIKKFIDSEKK